MPMTLQSLSIQKGRRYSFKEDDPKYLGTAVFSNPKGEIKLNLTEEHIARIFEVCSNSITEIAQEAAESLLIER